MLGAASVAHATQHARGKNHSKREAKCLGELLWRNEAVTPSSPTSGVTLARMCNAPEPPLSEHGGRHHFWKHVRPGTEGAAGRTPAPEGAA